MLSFLYKLQKIPLEKRRRKSLPFHQTKKSSLLLVMAGGKEASSVVGIFILLLIAAMPNIIAVKGLNPPFIPCCMGDKLDCCPSTINAHITSQTQLPKAKTIPLNLRKAIQSILVINHPWKFCLLHQLCMFISKALFWTLPKKKNK